MSFTRKVLDLRAVLTDGIESLGQYWTLCWRFKECRPNPQGWGVDWVTIEEEWPLDDRHVQLLAEYEEHYSRKSYAWQPEIVAIRLR